MSASLISVRGLVKRFGAVIAADNVSVEIRPQETVGIIGANGAGKTTFVNMVTGYLKPDDGAIFFRGHDITRLPPREVTRLGIRRSFQVAQLFPNLSVRDNVLVALAAASGAFPSPLAMLRTPEQIEEAGRILNRVGLSPFAHRKTTELPQGQRKLLDIALAMIGQSAVLLLDEPTSGISADEKFPLMDLVLNAVRAAEATVLFIEHDMEIVERYSDRVIAFYDGRVIADGEPAHVFADPDVRRFVVGAELHRRDRGRA
ncbi:MAG: ABC transporter ATP-binding protein [Rhodoplanes sp.]|nr:ABC transporter ATP-binding protein [Rhodoplanes sp.]